MKNLIKPVVVLTVIAFLCTAALAGVNMLTEDIINAAAAEKTAKTMQQLFPQEQGFEVVKVDEEILKSYHSTGVYRASSGAGFIVEVATSGYGGEISMMVALSPRGDILGVKVLSHEETNGIGTRVVEGESFLSSFVGKNATEQAGIDAVAGATVSSEAVVAGVNSAANLFVSAAMAAEE